MQLNLKAMDVPRDVPPMSLKSRLRSGDLGTMARHMVAASKALRKHRHTDSGHGTGVRSYMWAIGNVSEWATPSTGLVRCGCHGLRVAAITAASLVVACAARGLALALGPGVGDSWVLYGFGCKVGARTQNSKVRVSLLSPTHRLCALRSPVHQTPHTPVRTHLYTAAH